MNKSSEKILYRQNDARLNASDNISKYLLVEPASAVSLETNALDSIHNNQIDTFETLTDDKFDHSLLQNAMD